MRGKKKRRGKESRKRGKGRKRKGRRKEGYPPNNKLSPGQKCGVSGNEGAHK